MEDRSLERAAGSRTQEKLSPFPRRPPNSHLPSVMQRWDTMCEVGDTETHLHVLGLEANLTQPANLPAWRHCALPHPLECQESGPSARRPGCCAGLNCGSQHRLRGHLRRVTPVRSPRSPLNLEAAPARSGIQAVKPALGRRGHWVPFEKNAARVPDLSLQPCTSSRVSG